MQSELFRKVKHKTILLGGSDFNFSTRKNKRFMVTYNNKKIHFGDPWGVPYIELNESFQNKRKAYFARHSKIKNKKGEYVIHLKTSPAYWSANLLWNPI